MCVLKNGHMGHLYFGKRIHDKADFSYLVEECQRPMTSYIYEDDRNFSLEHIRQEYPVYGTTDYRHPSIEIFQKKGSRISEFVYEGYEIIAGKVNLQGLPATYTESDEEAMTLRVYLKDALTGVLLELLYTVFSEYNAIARSVCVKNTGTETVHLLNVMSLSLDLPDQDYVWMQLSGAWARERYIKERTLEQGITAIDSRRGNSSHEHNPFMILRRKHTNEYRGETIGFSLIYSGNFRIQAEVDTHNVTRITAGINPKGFDWKLEAGEMFQTPEAVMVYSESGLNGMSQTFHKLYGRRLARGYWRDRCRPILINNWEATYFDFTEERLVEIASKAKKCGVELFVLDDGWFGARRNDRAGLGDWIANMELLPNGISGLANRIEELGMKFGLWIEPEMVNPKSELYEKHKDWVIHLPNRDEYYFRNQLVLDLSNPKVQDYVFGVVDNLMTKYPDIAFFKWDCNSPITNIYSVYLKDKQSHLYIDYVRGLYNVLERVKAKYPDLPMMLCSGGGGRSDYEALSYFTEFWPSDNTDPIERLFIQWGFSQVFPAKTMCAHVTTWNKNSSVKFRTDVAMMCKLGFDIKLADMSKDDETYCRTAVQNYNRLKPVVLEGDMYRLVSPYGSNHTSTMYVGKDKDKAVVFAFDIHPRYAEKTLPVRLQGLDADKMYRVKEINLMPGANSSLSGNGEVFSGEFLMNVGLNLFTTQQLNSRVIEVVAE